MRDILVQQARRLLNLEPEGETFPYVTARGLLLFLFTGGLILLTIPRERGLGITAYVRGPGRPTYGSRKPHKYEITAHARMRFWQRVHRLQRQGILELSQNEKTTKLTLSTKGRARIEKHLIKNFDLQLPKPAQWDGRWRVFAFDVPESKRFARDALRGVLERLGFYRLQKSIFVYPYPCTNELTDIVDYFSLRPFVTIVETEHLGWQDRTARKIFKL